MHNKLAGRLPLQDMIANVISDARSKLAAAEEPKKEEKKAPPPFAKKDEKKEEPKEKMSSAFDFTSADEVEKLASALDHAGDLLLKEAADKKELGGESAQGGEVLQTAVPPKGQQPYKKDSSKSHNVPMSTGMQSGGDNPASTQVPNDHAKAPGGPAYPAKGVLKTATVSDKIDAALRKVAGEAPPFFKKEEKKPEEKKPEPKKADDKKDEGEEKKSSALDYILGKVAESSQGGMTLDSKSGEGPKPSDTSSGGNDARKALESNSAAINMKKVDGKKPQKRQLSEVLTEPAQSKAQDSKVHENLQNASKGGVKIAEAKAILQKIAQDGCKCNGKGECMYCKMKSAADSKKKEKESGAGMAPSTLPTPPGMSGSI